MRGLRRSNIKLSKDGSYWIYHQFSERTRWGPVLEMAFQKLQGPERRLTGSLYTALELSIPTPKRVSQWRKLVFKSRRLTRAIGNYASTFKTSS